VTVITQDSERLSPDPHSRVAVLERFLEHGVSVEFSTEEGKARFEFFKVCSRILIGASAQLEELEHSR
jgi:hypothetical protein